MGTTSDTTQDNTTARQQTTPPTRTPTWIKDPWPRAGGPLTHNFTLQHLRSQTGFTSCLAILSTAMLTASKDDAQGKPMHTSVRIHMGIDGEEGIELQPLKTTDEEMESDVPRSLALARMSLPELERELRVTLNMVDLRQSAGLKDAAARLQANGPNMLTPLPEQPEIVKFLLQFLDPFMLLLNLTGWLSFAAYQIDPAVIVNLWVAVVLWAAVFISASFSYITERRVGDAMALFKKMMPANARVIRNGTRSVVPSASLVVGDIVHLLSGDQVPADCRLLATTDLKVEKSSLTGESLPVSVGAAYKPTNKLEDAYNIVFSSTQVMEGEGYGVVVATGDHTLIGTIANMVTNIKQELTPVQVEIHHFVKRLAVFAFVLACTFFIIGGARGKPWLDAFIQAFVVVMVACIPEGLPLTVLTCLSVTSKRMAAKNVFIKQLSSVETLGSVTAIASDKTGTLTQNKMTVAGVWVDEIVLAAPSISVSLPVHQPWQAQAMQGSPQPAGAANQTSYHMLELAALLCNRAKYSDERLLTSQEASCRARSQLLTGVDNTTNMYRMRDAFPSLLASIEEGISLRSALLKFTDNRGEPQGERKVLGDASDTALLNFVATRQDVELLRYHYQSVFELPFNSRNKYALTIVRPVDVGTNEATSTDESKSTGLHETKYTRRMLLLKGAPEVVISKCSNYSDRGQTKPIDDAFRASFAASIVNFGDRGQRVLGFAWLELDPKQFPPEMDTKFSAEAENYPMSGLTFLGLISLVDPPKASVPAAVQLCRQAGIKVLMVTGDHATTAAAIARQVGIITRPTADQLAVSRGCSVSEIVAGEADAVVVEGSQLASFKQSDWDRVLATQEIVFARTTPQQKLQIVENLQRLNHCVAVTGDGVNDSPALKKADVGVAMGIMGSDVARDASDAILMDDDFASIVEGVRQGRCIFDNLAKTISYTASHLIPETIPTLLYLAFDFPAALLSLAIVAIDCGTELGPAISFSHETPEADVMARPPRDRRQRMIGPRQVYYMFVSGLINSAWTWLAYCLVFMHYDVPLSRLPWSAADYWVSGSDPFAIAGPSGCSMDSTSDAYTTDCVTIDDTRQVQIVNEVAGCFFYMITMFQLFHVFMCKTRSVSVFSHPMTDNVVMIYGVALELALIFLFLFVPDMNSTLVGLPFPGKFFALPLIGWGVMFVFAEGRKWWTRKYPDGKVAAIFSW